MRVRLSVPIKHGEFYKAGDVIDVSEQTADRLFLLQLAVRAEIFQSQQPPGGGGPPETKPVDEMSKDELQAELAAYGVPFQANAKVSELKALLKEAQAQ